MQQKGNKGEFSNRQWIELILHRMTTYLYHKNTTDYRTNSADFHNYEKNNYRWNICSGQNHKKMFYMADKSPGWHVWLEVNSSDKNKQ